MHVALLGDSIFDNGGYTCGQPDVAAHLRSLLPAGSSVSLLAKDGATTATFAPQRAALTPAMSQLVLSLGGNDALGCLGLLSVRVDNVGQGLHLVGQRVGQFEAAYRLIVNDLRTPQRPLLLCTIYDGSFDDKDFALIAQTALAAFNDVIIRVALEQDLPLLDLRSVLCTDPKDYTLEIEPSAQGGRKIAGAIFSRLATLASASFAV
jgi:hypothetical protein